MKIRNVACGGLFFLFCALAGFAQTTALEGEVKGTDGAPLKGALIKIEREDIRGHYQVKTDKKGHYYYGGLPIGTYKITLEVDGHDIDYVDKVHTRLGDPLDNNFDMQALAKKRQELNQAADTGQLTKEQARGMSPEEKAAFEKANKERSEMKAKNKEVNDAYNAGREAMKAGEAAVMLARTKVGPDRIAAVRTASDQYGTAVTQLTKGTQLAPDQPAIWANLGDSEVALAKLQTGTDQENSLSRGIDAYKKALELKPDDASIHNNYGLALAQAKKFDEAEAELAKAAQLDPPSAGKYYFNLGALLTNNNQTEQAGAAFKKAIDADPKYADAQYQYGLYLISKAKLGADGKYEPVPGTREAFQAYIDLQPNGPNADSAKAMLSSLSGSVDTSYQNPSAKKKKTSKSN